MEGFNEILARVEREVTNLQFPFPPKSLYDPIEYVLSMGGKRLRPALTLMSCNLFSDNLEDAVKPALGLEVFHNFTLLHDDLMDKADKRRNKPTVHKVWNDNTAILSGDAMVIAAYRLIGETKPEFLKDVLDLFTVTALQICGGQQYDMEFESRMDVSVDEYIEMIRLKTAVLLACALKMGAIVGKASAADAENLYQFGIQMGLAFQLQDDLLDVYGDTATFGKNIGGDILCNKKTFLLINAFKKSNDQQRKNLITWIEKDVFDPKEKITTVTQLYNDFCLKELSEAKIRECCDRAMIHLSKVGVPAERKTGLEELSNRLMIRQS